jgi:hypothetical protein
MSDSKLLSEDNLAEKLYASILLKGSLGDNIDQPLCKIIPLNKVKCSL